jgi:TonB family protein
MIIMISYRRADSTPITGRIYDRLLARFGADHVFMDIDSIPIGTDYRTHIDDSLKSCDVLLTVIGPRWLGAGDVGARRIDDPTDLVRLEVAHALERNIRVVPLLVEDAQMPPIEELPEDLKGLRFRNALRVDSGLDFHHHIDRLSKAIETFERTISVTKPEQISQPSAPSVTPPIPEPSAFAQDVSPQHSVGDGKRPAQGRDQQPQGMSTTAPAVHTSAQPLIKEIPSVSVRQKRVNKKPFRRIGLAMVAVGQAVVRGAAAGASLTIKGFRDAGRMLFEASKAIYRGAVAGFGAVKEVLRRAALLLLALSKEILRGTGITLIPAALVATCIWYFAIRSPPEKTVTQSLPQTQPTQALIAPPMSAASVPELSTVSAAPKLVANTVYEGTIHVKNDSSVNVPLLITIGSDLKSGTMTQSGHSGDVVVKFTGVWDGATLHAVTDELMSEAKGINWEPESFTLWFTEDGKRGSYECKSGGRVYSAELSPGVLSSSAVRALAIFAPKPDYPIEARRRHITGSGVCVVTIDPDGNVIDATMARSIGNPILDNAAVSAFRRWRFRPGTDSKIKVPINFTMTGDSR